MSDIHQHLTATPNDDDEQEVAPDINNHGVEIIRTGEDGHQVVRILHRDGFGLGVFSHEPIPPPPRFWEPIDPGSSDSDNDIVPENDSDDDDDDDDDETNSERKGKKKKKHEKRSRRSQKVHNLTSEKKRVAGGKPINFPDSLMNQWGTDPRWYDKFADKENVIPANPLTPPHTSRQTFERVESSERPHKKLKTSCLSMGENTMILIPDIHTLLDDESRKLLIQLKERRGTELIVPSIVIKALEHLRELDSFSRTESKAAYVLKWIEECIASCWIHVSPPRKQVQVEGVTCSSFNLHDLFFTAIGDITLEIEDYVLECAHHSRKETSDAAVIILSDSSSLSLRAKGEGLLCERAKDFCSTFMCSFSSSSRSSKLVPVRKEASKGLRILCDNSFLGNKQ